MTSATDLDESATVPTCPGVANLALHTTAFTAHQGRAGAAKTGAPIENEEHVKRHLALFPLLFPLFFRSDSARLALVQVQRELEAQDILLRIARNQNWTAEEIARITANREVWVQELGRLTGR
jgi:hypothetical protein